jgi:hypothetical protein
VSERARAWLGIGAALVLVTALLVFLRSGPEGRPRPAPAPLASPAIAAGTVGGLLPDVLLTGRGGAVPARDLRPAVLVLAAPDCGCLEAVRQVVTAAAPVRVVTYVVEAGPSLEQAATLAARAGGDAGAFADPGGALARAYGLRSPAALVLVRSDGVVTQVVPAVAPSLSLDRALRGLVA